MLENMKKCQSVSLLFSFIFYVIATKYWIVYLLEHIIPDYISMLYFLSVVLRQNKLSFHLGHC
jgi:hypothetical protein